MSALRFIRQKNLGRLLRPRHIAFIGGSQTAGPIAACQRAGYTGQIWSVTPRRQEIGGVRCVPTIQDLPEPPDAAVLALSPQRTVDAVAELAVFGAGGAVCMAAGFAEMNAEGEALQEQIKQTAGEMAVLGPNCMGVLNQFDGAAAWGTDNHMQPVGDRGAAIISQSGAFLFGMTNIEQVFPLGYAISTGNQAVCDTADCIQAVLDDPRVKAIGIYLEGINNGQALGEACWRAKEQQVPLVVLKGGDTAAGEAVAIGHTGAMVVERDIWDAFAQRYGLVEVSTPKALVETLKLLTIGGMPRGNRLSAVTFSGGLNGLIAAKASALGLELPALSAAGYASLRAAMPETVPVGNPLDLNLPFSSSSGMSMQNGPSIAQGIIDLGRDVADMLVFFLDVPRPDEKELDTDWWPSLEGMGQVQRALNIPTAVAGILPEGLDVRLRQKLFDMGVAPLLGFADALEAVAVAGRVAAVYQQQKGKVIPPNLIQTETTHATRLLNEAEAKEILRPYSLNIPPHWAGPVAGVAQAAEAIGFPVVAKILSDQIPHKAKVGGVQLHLQTAAEVDTAVAQMAAQVKQTTGEQITQFLVEKMIEQPVAEYIIGIKKHEGLGFALMVGRGGISVENLRNYATMLLPLDPAELDAGLAKIGMLPHLLGYSALVNATQAVAAFVTDYAASLVSLDLNPIIVTADGHALAADALIQLHV